MTDTDLTEQPPTPAGTGRAVTEQDVQIANDRLRGTGSWNGNGLLVFLALTHRKDKMRAWMEPLRDLCEEVVDSQDNGGMALTAEQAEQMDALVDYSATFQAKIDKE